MFSHQTNTSFGSKNGQAYGSIGDAGNLNSVNSSNGRVTINAKTLKNHHSFMSTDSNDNFESVAQRTLKGIHGRLVRTGSYIKADTGERVKRVKTLDTNPDQFAEDLERQPLIRTVEEQRPSLYARIGTSWDRFTEWFFKNKYQYVLKCSLAYLIASLAVYSPYFSSFLGKSDSKHVVATVAVYFHPSRTFGSMHQSLIFATGAIIFSFVTSLISTGISSQLNRNGFVIISALNNLVFVSVALGLVSYVKQKMNHPTFNVACSLAAISLISAIVKEGSQYPNNIPYARFLSLFKIVSAGSLISVAICYLVVPTSAVKALKRELNSSCTLMSQYLLQIEKAFINDSDIASDEQISDLSSKLKSNSTTLTKLLEESKYELYLVGREKEYSVFTKLVKSTQFLESQLGGLKGSAEMQWSTLHSESNRSSKASTHSISTIDSNDANYPLARSPEISSSTVSLDEMSAFNSAQLFDLFIHYLGPSLKSFGLTIRGVLDGMPFEATDDYPTREIFHYRNSLKLARELFKTKYTRAMTKLYSQRLFKEDKPLENKIDEEEVAASCGNFASILSEYSKELDVFIGLLTRFSETIEDDERSWNWLKFWKRNSGEPPVGDNFPDLNFAIKAFNTTLQKRANITDQPNTWGYKTWEFFSHFRKVEVQFGIRVGLGAFVLAALAYLPDTKQIFNEWRGEWALVTYAIIMNKSLGGTTMTVNWRFLGTFLGALAAYVIWSIFDANVYVLCFSGWIISLYCFHIILNWNDVNAYGRFILLTFNIIALYSYNTTRSEDLEDGDTAPIILDIAIHRFLSIIAGVIWALIMTISFLPMTARRRLKRGLAILWLRLGVIWNTDPLQTKNRTLVGLADQSGINNVMRELELLLKQAPKETRLKGRFRSEIYKKLLKSTEKIIDAFQNINTMISIEPELSQNELTVLSYTSQERDELQNRIFLIFYMISSSMTLGIPLPSKPASTEHSRDRIMGKLGEIRKESALLTDEDYVLLYSYVLVSNVITNELNKIIKYLGELYGLVEEEIFEI